MSDASHTSNNVPSSGMDLSSAGIGHDAECDEFIIDHGSRHDTNHTDRNAGSQDGCNDEDYVEEEEEQDGEDQDEYEEEDEEFDPTRIPTFTKK